MWRAKTQPCKWRSPKRQERENTHIWLGEPRFETVAAEVLPEIHGQVLLWWWRRRRLHALHEGSASNKSGGPGQPFWQSWLVCITSGFSGVHFLLTPISRESSSDSSSSLTQFRLVLANSLGKRGVSWAPLVGAGLLGCLRLSFRSKGLCGQVCRPATAPEWPPVSTLEPSKP